MKKFSRKSMLSKVSSRTKSNRSNLLLQLGCGTDSAPSFINLDKAALKDVDVVHDLNVFPYPFEDNCFDEVIADNILEHVDDLVNTLRELHRICRPGAILKVSVPYWNSIVVWADPTHKRGFTLDTFTYFEKGSFRSYYGNFNIKVLRQKLIPSPVGKFIPNPFRKALSLFLSNIIKGIYAELEIVK